MVSARGLSVTTWLIIINVAIHAIGLLFLRSTTNLGLPVWTVFHEFGHFSSARAFFYLASDGKLFLNLEVWRLITFQFLHDPTTIWHLGLNMLGLWIFGRTVEEYLGRKNYLAFYLMCGICGALLYVVLNLLGQLGIAFPGVLVSDPRVPLIGASAGVFGVILACAYIAPNTIVQLIIPPIPLKMKFFAYGYVALAAFNLLVGGSNAGGDAAHLGGAAAGFFFIRHSHFLTDFFEVFKNSKKERQRAGGQAFTSRPRARGGQAEVDRILAKVSQHGLASLTEKEKQILRKASEEGQQR